MYLVGHRVCVCRVDQAEGCRSGGRTGLIDCISWQASQKGLQIGGGWGGVGRGLTPLAGGQRRTRCLITNQEITLSAWHQLRHSQKLLARPVL